MAQKLSSQRQRMQLALCAYLFYIKDPPMTQTQIAAKLKIHVSQVSRYLSKARETKLVRITLDLPREEELQLLLMRKFNLHDAVVVPIIADKKIDGQGAGEDTPRLRIVLGRAAANYLKEENSPLVKSARVGITCGETLLEMILALPKGRFIDLDISPLTIEGFPEEAHQAPSTLVGLFRAMCSGNPKCYGPQLMPGNPAERQYWEKFRNRLKNEIEKRTEKLDVAFVGIGRVEPDNKNLTYSKFLANAKISKKQVRNLGVVGEIANRPYDASGRDVFDQLKSLNDHIISVDLKSLRSLASKKKVIAVAGGIQKHEAIKAALNAGYINVLVTDSLTASVLVGSSLDDAI